MHKDAAADLFGASSPEEHLEWARELASSATCVRNLERSVEFARNIYDELGSQITSWRKAIVVEVRLLRDEFQEETQRWLDSLRPDVRQAITCQKGVLFLVAGLQVPIGALRFSRDSPAGG